MSGSLPLVTGPLTDAERTDARRFMGYPAAGSVASSQSSWRFFQSYGQMEYRLLNASPTELTVIRQYLLQCASLETEILGASSKIGIDTAAVFKRNANEIRDRMRLFDDWRRRLCGFLGIMPGEALGAGGSSVAVSV